MTKYKFIKDKKEPSDEQIQRKMNFNRVLQQSQGLKHYKDSTKPLYKKPLFLGFIILLMVLSLVIIIDEKENSKPIKKSSHSKDSLLHQDSIHRK